MNLLFNCIEFLKCTGPMTTFFQGEPPLDCKAVVARRNEGVSKKLARPSEPVLELIRQAGFGGVFDIPFMSIDLALITTLLERWRLETHSFHLRMGEWTITLQDVEVLLGLPIDGGPVIGKVESPDESANLCNRLLGIRPVEMVDRDGCKVKLKWLRTHFNGHLVVGYMEEQVRQ